MNSILLNYLGLYMSSNNDLTKIPKKIFITHFVHGQWYQFVNSDRSVLLSNKAIDLMKQGDIIIFYCSIMMFHCVRMGFIENKNKNNNTIGYKYIIRNVKLLDEPKKLKYLGFNKQQQERFLQKYINKEEYIELDNDDSEKIQKYISELFCELD